MRLWILVLSLGISGCLYRSPGVLHPSSQEPLNASQLTLRDRLRQDVRHLADEIGPRNGAREMGAVWAAEAWITKRLETAGLEARRDVVALGDVEVANVEASFPGGALAEEVIVIGAHYDTVVGSPGANDNASGVALLLALAEDLRGRSLDRTVRVLFFVNEESPFTGGHQMGSKVYAERCKARGDRIVAMIAVDSVGCYSSEPGSQDYPALAGWSLPSKGNFVAFSSNMENRPLLDRTVALFQERCRFPSLGAATDSPMSARSDHAPFWWQGYPAIAMSDTSEYRDPNYHRAGDTPAHLDYDDMTRMAGGFLLTVRALAKAPQP